MPVLLEDLESKLINYCQEIISEIRGQLIKGTIGQTQGYGAFKYVAAEDFEYKHYTQSVLYPISCKHYRESDENMGWSFKAESLYDSSSAGFRGTCEIMKEYLQFTQSEVEFFLNNFSEEFVKRYFSLWNKMFKRLELQFQELFEEFVASPINGLKDELAYLKQQKVVDCQQIVKDYIISCSSNQNLKQYIQAFVKYLDLKLTTSLSEEEFICEVQKYQTQVLDTVRTAEEEFISFNDFIRRQIFNFLNDIQEKSVEWKLKIWLHGISVKGKSHIAVLEQGTIRMPEESDFEKGVNQADLGGSPYMELTVMPPLIKDFQGEFTNLQYKPYYSEDELRFDTPLSENYYLECEYPTSSVLTGFLQGKTPDEIIQQIENIFLILSLYKLGSVNFERIEMTTQSYILKMIGSNHIVISDQIWPPFYRYYLNQEELDLFGSFYENVIGPVKALHEYSPLKIAIGRYKEALSLPVEASIEQRLTLGVTALEALFNNLNEDGYARSFRVRISNFLDQVFVNSAYQYQDFQVENSSELRTLLFNIYDARSKYVHGAMEQRITPIEAWCKYTLEIVRISILYYLQDNCFSVEDKSRLLTKIENNESLNFENVELGWFEENNWFRDSE